MTNLELLEEIRKDYVTKFNNDPWINRTCRIIIDEFKERSEQLNLCEVSRSLPTNTDYLLKVRDVLFDEHVERLNKQTKEWNLREGISLGLGIKR